MIESISISDFRSRLARYLERLRHQRHYKIRLLDRRKPVVTLANVSEKEKGRRLSAGRAMRRAAELAEKIEPKDASPDISTRVDHYLYGGA